MRRPGSFSGRKTLIRFLLRGLKGKDGKFGEWLEVKCDPAGRPVELKDQWGMLGTIGYDKEGRPSSWSGKRGKLELHHDDQGRLARVTTSWGEKYAGTYDPKTGALRKKEWSVGDATAVAEYQDGRLVLARDFDGAETEIVLGKEGETKGRLKEIRTPTGLTLRYRTEGPDTLVVDCGDVYQVRYRFDAAGRIAGIEECPIR